MMNNLVEMRMRAVIRERGFPRSLYHWQKLADIPESTFYNIVKGRRRPGVDLALRLSSAAGVAVEDLFKTEDSLP